MECIVSETEKGHKKGLLNPIENIEIIQTELHQGHFSSRKTQDLVENSFYILESRTKVGRIVKSCVECIVSEAKRDHKERLLNPIENIDRPLLKYYLDFKSSLCGSNTPCHDSSVVDINHSEFRIKPASFFSHPEINANRYKIDSVFLSLWRLLLLYWWVRPKL